MKFGVKKQVYMGIIYGMISMLLFSCSASHKSVTGIPGKHARQFDESRFKMLYYNGLIQKTQNNYEDAMGYFRQCLVMNPASPAANFEVSQLLNENKQPDSSLVYIKRAMNGDPQNIWYGYFYAQNLQELSRYKEVVKVYEDLVKTHPAVTDLYYKLALAQLQAQEYKEALDTYNKMEEKTGPLDVDLSMDKIEILEKIKEYPKAELEIKKIIYNNPSTTNYYYMLLNLYDL